MNPSSSFPSSALIAFVLLLVLLATEPTTTAVVAASATRAAGSSATPARSRSTLRGRYESAVRELKGSKGSKNDSEEEEEEDRGKFDEAKKIIDEEGQQQGKNDDKKAEESETTKEKKDNQEKEEKAEKEEREVQVKEKVEGKQGNGEAKVAAEVVTTSAVHGIADGLGTCGTVPSVVKGVYYGKVGNTFRQSYGAPYLCDYDDCCVSGCCYPLQGQGYIHSQSGKWIPTAGCCSDYGTHCVGKTSPPATTAAASPPGQGEVVSSGGF